jgi:hypothetical protein
MDGLSTKEKIFIAVFAILLLIGIAFFAQLTIFNTYATTGTVVDLQLTQAMNSNSVGSTSGNPVFVHTTTTGGYSLIVNVNGNIETIDVSADRYYGTKIGDVVSLVCNHFTCALRDVIR